MAIGGGRLVDFTVSRFARLLGSLLGGGFVIVGHNRFARLRFVDGVRLDDDNDDVAVDVAAVVALESAVANEETNASARAFAVADNGANAPRADWNMLVDFVVVNVVEEDAAAVDAADLNVVEKFDNDDDDDDNADARPFSNAFGCSTVGIDGRTAVGSSSSSLS